MPRKLLRKYLPSHETIRGNRWIGLFGTALHHHNLWHLNRRSAAGGVAVGLFTGLIPGPFQMLSAALFAIVLRVNLPVAMVATLYTNPVTIVPLYLLAYQLGTRVLGQQGPKASAADLDLIHLPITDWIPALMHWMAAMGKPFIFGLILLAILLAGTGYVAVSLAWRLRIQWAWRKRRRARLPSMPR